MKFNIKKAENEKNNNIFIKHLKSYHYKMKNKLFILIIY